MHRLTATVVCVVGDRAREALGPLGEAPDVTLVLADADLPVGERAALAWRACRVAGTPHVVHDADPPAEVADAWIGLPDSLLLLDTPDMLLAGVDRVVPGRVGVPGSR